MERTPGLWKAEHDHDWIHVVSDEGNEVMSIVKMGQWTDEDWAQYCADMEFFATAPAMEQRITELEAVIRELIDATTISDLDRQHMFIGPDREARIRRAWDNARRILEE